MCSPRCCKISSLSGPPLHFCNKMITTCCMGLPWWLRAKECRFNPWVRKIPGEGNGSPLQYSCLGNLMDREAWQAVVHGVARVRHDLVTIQQPVLYEMARDTVSNQTTPHQDDLRTKSSASQPFWCNSTTWEAFTKYR